MLRVIFGITVYIYCYTSYAQTATEFIKLYNEHIDPKNTLDSLNSFHVKKELRATGVLNSTPVNLVKIDECQYFANGGSKCINTKTGHSLDLNLFPPIRNRFSNALKTELNFIPITQDSTFFRIISVSDSITVIEQVFSSFHKFIYTFDSKTKDLIQMENFFVKNESIYSSKTRYLVYQRIDSILVAISITFQNDFLSATLEHSNCSFE